MLSMLSAETTILRIRLERWQWLALILLGVACAFLPPELIVVAIGAVVVGVAIVTQPLLGLGLALLLGPVDGWEKVFIGGPIAQITTGRIVLWVTILAWFGRKLLRGRIPIPKTFINLPILLYVGVGLVSLWDAVSVFDGIKELLKWLEAIFIVWIIVDLTRDWPRKTVINTLVALLLSVACVQAAWGIFQFIIRGNGPAHFIISGRLYRGTGSFMQPNPYGGYIALALCLAVGALAGVMIDRWQKLEMPRKPLTLVRQTPLIAILALVVALLTFALIGSWSRGAWFNFLAALAVFTYTMPRSRERGLIFVALGALSAILLWNSGIVPPALQQRLLGFLETFTTINVQNIVLTPSNYAVVERLAHWQAGLNMAASSIWLGVGLGNYAAAYPEFMVAGWPEPLGHAHNIYINVLGEMGILGLISYAVLWAALFSRVIHLVRTLDWPYRGVAIGIFAGWVGLTVHHLLDNLYVNNNIFYLGVMFTVLVMLEFDQEESLTVSH